MAFDKSVKDIKVQRGQNEVCYGKICTFQHRLKGSLSEGQNLKLPLRLGFVETDDHPHVSGIEFNGEKICGIDIPVGNEKVKLQKIAIAQHISTRKLCQKHCSLNFT